MWYSNVNEEDKNLFYYIPKIFHFLFCLDGAEELVVLFALHIVFRVYTSHFCIRDFSGLSA